jgi:hypothetical protein
MVWKLLKRGGWMILDDVENDKPKIRHVKEGLEMFLAETPNAEIAWKRDFVVCVRKTSRRR